MTEVLASLRGVSKAFEGRQALVDLTLEVRAGEVLGLLGPNGAGKTTAVRILTGLLAPDSGSAQIDGHDVQTAPLAARRRLAFVPDGAPLYANLSPRQHLELVGRLHGVGADRLKSESVRLIEALDLGERIDDPIGGFSHGMRQKVSLACALLPEPALLVLDEPLSGLDAPTAAVVKEILRAWADRGRAVLYTSHLLDVVERVCDRMAILTHGKLVALGTLDELRDSVASRDPAPSGNPGDGSADTLEQVFRAVTRAEDPAEKARRVLG